MLQINTVYFIGCIIVTLCCLLNFLTWRANRNIKGVVLHLLYPALILLTLLLFSLHYINIPLISVGMANLLLFAASILHFYAITRFFNRKHDLTIIFATITACLAIILLWYTVAEPSLYKRILIFSIQRIVEAAMLTYIVVAGARTRYPYASTIYIVHAVLLITGLILRNIFLFEQPSSDMLKSDWFSLGIFFNAVITPLLYAMGIAFLCHEKHARDLQQLTDSAQQDAELRGLFLSTMSHEIRTPLNGILGSAQLIMSQSISPKNQPYCEAIINSAESLNLLIDKVLDFASLEQGNETLYEEDIELTPWLENLCLLLTPLAEQKNIGFKLENQLPEQACYYFDQQKMRQVLINLVGNAIKFTDKGSVTLSVCEHQLNATTHTLRFSVIDTGPGIATNDIKNLTEPYMQSKAGKSKGGTGLGLAITERLLQSLASKLEIESQLGKGSQFSFEVAFSLGELSLVEQRHHSDDYMTGLTTLLVEDLPLNQKLALEFMAMDEHKVTLADSGHKAIELLKANTYDLVLLDMNLPDISGQDVLKQLQQVHHKNESTPFLAFTASLSQDEVKEYLSLGIKDIVAKPIKLDKLRQAIINSQTNISALSKNEITDVLFDQGAAQSLESSFSEDELSSVYNDFVLSIRSKMTRIEKSVDEDADKAIKEFHRLASTALQLGFNRFGLSLKQAERQLLEGDNKIDFEQLKQQWQQSLNTYLDHIKNTL